jgi:glycosyltransferase involved in cell wall biosynthesis
MSERGGRPRLVHLTTTDMSLDWLLGAQLHAFADAGYDVVGVSAPGPHVAALETAGIRHVPMVHATRSMSLGRDARALAEVRRVFRDLQPDIVHTHNPKPGVYGRLAGRAARVPVIVNTVHGLYALPEDPLRKRAIVYGLERVASACSDAELVQNAEDLETLAAIGVPRRKLHLLGNGVDLDRFDAARVAPEVRAKHRASMGIGAGDVVVGLVGRMVAEKGYREVFAAATMLRSSHPEVRIVVIGPGDPAKADAISAAEVADAERSGNVLFLGSRSDVDELYTAMDLYVLASWREGFPRSAMEAAAMGLPIVTTDIRGCRQVVTDGENGLLVPVRDAVAMAEAIGALARDATKRAAMAKAAREKACREFDQRRVIDITLETYERLRGRAAAASR